MDYTRFLIACCLWFHAANAFSEEFLKRLTQPKPGGILDVLKPPKIPGLNFQLGGSKHIGGSIGIGSLGFGFSLGGQYVPPGAGVNLPPKDLPIPDVDPQHPVVPDLKPQVPEVPKPQYPWEKENEKGKPRPNWEEYEDDRKHGSYEKDKVDKPKLNPYEESKEDTLPDWEDIGENKEEENDFEKKSESFNNGDLIGEGLIQPRRNRYRGRRFVESHVYHVPLLFRSNAKPFQVRVHSNPNTLTKDGSEH